jgi:hypothetical protein
MQPDSFVLELLTRDPDAVLSAMREHRLSFAKPPKSAAEYLATLERHHMLTAVTALHTMTDRF